MQAKPEQNEQSGSPAWNIIIVGPLGSGKGTQADMIAQKHGLHHIEMGKLLRRVASEPTELGRQIDRWIHHEGKLVPSEIAMGIIQKEVERIPSDVGVVFDGVPRSLDQVDYWDKEFPKLNRKLTHVVVLCLSENEIIRRLSIRRTCSREGTPWILGVDVPNDQSPCPQCGAPLVQREDDKPEVIQKRLETYRTVTEPIIARYQQRGIVHEINGEQSIEKVFANIEKALQA